MKTIYFFALIALFSFVFAQDSLRGYLLVVNSRNGTVSWINLQNKRIEMITKTGKDPREIALSKDQKFAIISNYKSHPPSLTLLDIVNKRMKRNIDLHDCTRPFGVHFKDNEHVIVACSGANELLIVNIHRGNIVERIKTTLEPHLLTVNRERTLAFTDDMHSNQIASIDLTHRKTTKTIQAGRTPTGIQLNLENNEIWVCNYDENTIHIYDIQSMRLKDRLHTGKGPFRVKFAKPNLAIVTNHEDDTCWIFNSQNKQKMKEFKFGTNSAPKQIWVQNEMVFVGLYNYGLVAMINLKTMEIEGYIHNLKGPSGMVYVQQQF